MLLKTGTRIPTRFDVSDGLRQLFREKALAQREVSSGMVLLDRALLVPLRSCILLKGEGYSGCTAVALELAAAFTLRGSPVVYVDTGESLFPLRLERIDTSLMVVVKPTGIKNLMNILAGLRDVKEKLLIIDNIDILAQWKNTFSSLGEDIPKLIRRADPSTTIIATQNKRGVSCEWDQVVTVEVEQMFYEDRSPIGHLAKIQGPRGYSTVYIEYQTGRLSLPYEQAILQHEGGTPLNGTFSNDQVTTRGIWNFVKEAHRFK